MEINATLFGQMITFGIFVWFTMSYVWPPLEKSLDERKKIIADGLAAAEKSRYELSAAAEKAERQMEQARVKYNEIIDNANKAANKIIEDAKDSAEKQKKEILTTGRLQLDSEVSKAKNEIQQEVLDMIFLGVEKICKERVDKNDYQHLVDELITKVST